MSRNLKFSFVLIAALAFAACGDDSGDEGTTPGAGDAGTGSGACASTDTYANYGKALIDTNCAICHNASLDSSPMMNVKLHTLEGIRAAKSRIIDHAVDLKPPMMPQAGPLPQADRTRLKAWLNCNAP
jgi:cytochrome c5